LKRERAGVSGLGQAVSTCRAFAIATFSDYFVHDDNYDNDQHVLNFVQNMNYTLFMRNKHLLVGGDGADVEEKKEVRLITREAGGHVRKMSSVITNERLADE